MSYELQFLPSALKEWRKLGDTIRQQFKAKLAERLETPHVPTDRLHGADLKDCYKIKLRASGYRLVYRVSDAAITVTVVAVGKRNRDEVYRTAQKR
ncbi:type II toxin-antitoxin system RelE family toxin [Methylobacterium pseudosasicola]|uniref:mRNA interferase RelE/StbE n=1 Tax=Methylobacterium pseudosasicola TaxID=582667 RepID=A0A1I4II63_9HYPH|nr:type II toxin-antitoxin system RelE/ParE family toxin [Methylobacterium pseudosasicola]SFL53693.1 mRNA interferase RelE/StbE [Methylobacterium pseudosasicola]